MFSIEVEGSGGPIRHDLYHVNMRCLSLPVSKDREIRACRITDLSVILQVLNNELVYLLFLSIQTL